MSRRYRRSPRRALIVLAVLSGFLLLRVVIALLTPPDDDKSLAVLREGPCEVVRVVDGDTLVVRQDGDATINNNRGDTIRVRLLGIDAPESVKPNHPVELMGPEASAFTTEFVSGGQAHVVLDKRRIDQYGRYLAYIYVGDRMLNEELVRTGLARVSDYPGDSQSIARQLRKAEEEAREARRGIWSGIPDDN